MKGVYIEIGLGFLRKNEKCIKYGIIVFFLSFNVLVINIRDNIKLKLLCFYKVVRNGYFF